MPSIISIVGRKKSGKTTLLVGLLPELVSRGYRVATVKHVSHGLSFDRPDTDSSRHIQAGSVATVIIAPDQVILVKPTQVEIDLEDAVRLLGSNYDLVLIEGLKQSTMPKIEVHRKEKGPLLKDILNVVTIATDEHVDSAIKQFSLTDIAGIADFIETTILETR